MENFLYFRSSGSASSLFQNCMRSSSCKVQPEQISCTLWKGNVFRRKEEVLKITITMFSHFWTCCCCSSATKHISWWIVQSLLIVSSQGRELCSMISISPENGRGGGRGCYLIIRVQLIIAIERVSIIIETVKWSWTIIIIVPLGGFGLSQAQDGMLDAAGNRNRYFCPTAPHGSLAFLVADQHWPTNWLRVTTNYVSTPYPSWPQLIVRVRLQKYTMQIKRQRQPMAVKVSWTPRASHAWQRAILPRN